MRGLDEEPLGGHVSRLERRLRFFEFGILTLGLGFALSVWGGYAPRSARADDSSASPQKDKSTVDIGVSWLNPNANKHVLLGAGNFWEELGKLKP